MSTRVRVISVNRANFQGAVIQHDHGDGRWHWAQDSHTKFNHDELTAPVWVGTVTKEQKALYADILAGARPAPIRAQKKAAQPVTDEAVLEAVEKFFIESEVPAV